MIVVNRSEDVQPLIKRLYVESTHALVDKMAAIQVDQQKAAAAAGAAIPTPHPPMGAGAKLTE